MSTEWFYRIDEREHGPVAGKTLKLLAEVGQITPNTLVRKSTSKSWTEAHHVKQLFDAHNAHQNITAPPIIGQPADTQHANASQRQPPPQIRAVTEPPAIIPTAELATESDATLINIVTTPQFEESAQNGNHNPNDSNDDETTNTNNSRPLALLLTLVGLIILTIPTAWYLYTEPTTKDTNGSTQANYAPAPNATLAISENSPTDHSQQINDVFSKQAQWIDPTSVQFQLTRDARLSIAHVWLDTQQTKQPILNIVIKIENRNRSTELSLQRQFATQITTNRSDEFNPYVPLVCLARGDGQLLDSKAKLVNRTVPMSSEINETYQIALTVEQSADLSQLRVAVPKAWFNKSGYWGFEIPKVMISTSKPTEPPVQIASKPNPASANVVDTNSSVVGGENTDGNKKGVLPQSPFGNNAGEAKPKNGDQPTTIQDLQSQIDLEKKRVAKPSGDAPQ